MAAAALSMLALMAGCQVSRPGDGDLAGPPPVVLPDTSPGKLDIRVFVTLGGYDAASGERAVLDIAFQSGSHPVKFVANERVACAGTELKPYVGAFEVALPRAAVEGRSLPCQYEHGGGSAPFSFYVPPGVMIVSPKEGEQVKAGRETIVRYRLAPGPMPRVVALAANAKAWARPGAVTASEATLDTSALRGPGQVSVTWQSDTIQVSAADFHHSSGRAESMTMVMVTWV